MTDTHPPVALADVSSKGLREIEVRKLRALGLPTSEQAVNASLLFDALILSVASSYCRSRSRRRFYRLALTECLKAAEGK